MYAFRLWPLSLSCYPQASLDLGCCWNAVNGSTRPGKPHPAFLSPIHRLASYPFCWGWVWPWLLLWGFGPTNQREEISWIVLCTQRAQSICDEFSFSLVAPPPLFPLKMLFLPWPLSERPAIVCNCLIKPWFVPYLPLFVVLVTNAMQRASQQVSQWAKISQNN